MLKSRTAARACKTSLAARALGLAAILILCSSPADAALTGAATLSAVYDLILSAQFDRADRVLRDACAPAPAEACKDLQVVSTWWRIQIDPDNRGRDALLNEQARLAVNAAEAWTDRDPKNAEAWFYLAGAYAPLVQWQVLRGERLAAARNGNRIREALERALSLDPTLADAHFGIGVYQYYADVASTGAKVLRWLLLLPGGDRVKGLQAIDRTRETGSLLRAEADFQRYIIDIWYEHTPADAIAILKSLDARYPTNPIFLQRLAELYDTYLHDARASAETWQMLIDRAHADRVYEATRVIALAERKRRALF
jgi:tetratricopeptide (TPR) repeat protein